MKDIGTGVVSVALAIVGVLTVAIVVSNNANTSGVFSSVGNAFAKALRCAASPVTGDTSSCGITTNVTSSISF